MNKTNKLIKYSQYLATFSKEYLLKNSLNALVLGISGGIDSALTLTLLVKNNINVFPYFIDIDSSVNDKQCVKQLATFLKCKITTINLSKIYHNIIKTLNIKDKIAWANLKVRLRTITLYSIANNKGKCLVCGTSNADELYVGYYTKFGDICCDINLLAKLTKKDIYELSKFYNIPNIILSRKPSAGLYKNQTDEQELGISYSEIDNFLLRKKISKDSKQKILKKHLENLHKINAPITPKKYKDLITK